MKKILIIDNFDSFTFNLADYFGQLGYDVQVYRNTIDIPLIESLNPNAIVFSPGPSVPKNAGNMMKIIKSLCGKYPMLGVCLGHQAMIECFGGSLKFIEPVHGESSSISHDGKTIFKDISQNFLAGRYHSLAANKVPPCFEISARHENIVMGIRHKTLPLEGIQFHPESVLTMKDGAGLKLIKNFLDVYVKPKLSITSFLEKSISGELSIDEQEDFLKKNDTLSPEELKEAVLFLQKQMPNVPKLEGAIDICGTGGSGLARINTSTISAFIIASLGIKIAKHGNKAASGRFGSFDLLESLGINFENSEKNTETIYENQNVAFLFARKFHPVLKYFAEIRKKIGKPTFFNILGPLLSPVNAKKQIIGTAFRDKMELIAQTCKLLGKEHVYVVSGEDGLDEVTLTGKTYVCELKNGEIKSYTISPKDFGVQTATFEEISGGNSNKNTKIALDILKGTCRSRHIDLVLINSALALKLAEKVSTLKEGYSLAKKVILSFLVYENFERVRMFSHAPSILLEIVQNKKMEVEARKRLSPLESLKKSIELSKRNFKKAINMTGMALIAEIKKKSPTKGDLLAEKCSVAKLAKVYEDNGVNAISVLCDNKFFGGDLSDLEEAKMVTQKVPLLCKDFIVDEYQIYEARKCGADAILLIAGILTKEQIAHFLSITKELNMSAICEVHTHDELRKVLDTPGEIIGINNRNLHTFEIDLNTTRELSSLIPKGKLIISESGICSRAEIDNLPKNVDAVLVGTSIVQSKNKEKKIRELLGKQTFLKICGIRKFEDAEFCEGLDVDFIGLNFVQTSKRKISLQTARMICNKLEKIKKVGVFQNQSIDEVNRIADELNLDFIQLSGDESVEFIRKCIKPVIKTVAIKSEADFKRAEQFKGYAAHIIIDGPCPGSGKSFDAELLRKFNGLFDGQFFIAGGINHLNLERVTKSMHTAPTGIDIASGAETNGEIDHEKIKIILNTIKTC